VAFLRSTSVSRLFFGPTGLAVGLALKEQR
jgi:hypothetical protein